MSTMLDLSVETLEKLLQGHQRSMNDTQTHLVESCLMKAELDCTKAPEPEVELHDPWADTLPIGVNSSSPTSSGEVSRYQIINYASNNYPLDKGITVNSPAVEIRSTSPIPPKYKSIVRLGPNVLAENDKTLKYLPYFPEEEMDSGWSDKEDLYNELKERYDTRVADLPARRQCAEKAELWRESITDLIAEVGTSANAIMYYLLLSHVDLQKQRPRIAEEPLKAYLERRNQCECCSVVFRHRHWIGVAASLPKPTADMELAIAGLLCKAFSNNTGFSIWHIVSTNPDMRRRYQDIKRSFSVNLQPTEHSKAADLRCMICYLHDCPGHGTFSEQDPTLDDNEESFDTDSDSDNELGHNVRKIVNATTTVPAPTTQSLCGLFCCEDRTRLRDLLGLDNEGNATGSFNSQYRETSDSSMLLDTDECGENCFWLQTRRRDTTINELLKKRANRFHGWRQNQIVIYQRLLELFGKKKRGACAIASACSIPCMVVWEELLVDIHLNHRPHPSNDQQTKPGQTRDLRYWLENSITHLHDERAPFVPCSHEGPCENNSKCSCWKENISCEHFCKCPIECGRRFRGCKCRQSAKACFNDDRCECFVLNRECDPWLCACGVVEILDPVNRHDANIGRGRCKNAGLQRDVPKRTIKNHSDVQGWGLFAGEDIRANEFIGEYKGEIISGAESDRRGTVYHHRGLEYLFKLNRDQEIDSTRAGNKMRFINNSQKAKNINCFARKSFCAGVQRIGLYAKRDIKAGEEFFFHYGYPDSVTKNFWERGERGPSQSHRQSVDGDIDDQGPNGTRSKGKGKLIAVKEQTKKRRREKGIAIPISRRKPKSDSLVSDISFGSNNRSSTSRRSRRRGVTSDMDDQEEEEVLPRSPSLGGTPPDIAMDTAVEEVAESSPSDEAYDSDDNSGSLESDSDSEDEEEDVEMLQLDGPADDDDDEEEEETVPIPRRRETIIPRRTSHRSSSSTLKNNNTKPSSSSSAVLTKQQHATNKKKKAVMIKKRSKKRLIGRARDTRYGGTAQKAGWITRKKNMAKAQKKEQQQQGLQGLRGKAVRKKRSKKRGLR